MDPEEKKDDKILGGTTTIDSYVQEDAAKKLKEGLMTAEEKEVKALQEAQQQQLRGEMNAADAQISSVADFLSTAEKERKAKLANDETARKRENAFRYISGVGDAISGVANLVGTAYGAANQKQTYNAPGLMSKIDASRAQRSQKMEDLNKKIDELRQRETDLKSAKSLREAQLNAAHAKEQLALKQQQEATAREEAWKKKEYELKVKDAETRRISAMASDTRAEAYANKPANTRDPRYRSIMGNDGAMSQIDVSSYNDFDGDYQKAFERAVKDIEANPAKAAEYGLTEEEIKKYKNESRDAGRIKEYFRVHTPRKAIVETMGAKGELSKYNKK